MKYLYCANILIKRSCRSTKSTSQNRIAADWGFQGFCHLPKSELDERFPCSRVRILVRFAMATSNMAACIGMTERVCKTSREPSTHVSPAQVHAVTSMCRSMMLCAFHACMHVLQSVFSTAGSRERRHQPAACCMCVSGCQHALKPLGRIHAGMGLACPYIYRIALHAWLPTHAAHSPPCNVSRMRWCLFAGIRWIP